LQKLIDFKNRERVQIVIFIALILVLSWAFIPHLIHQFQVGHVDPASIVKCGKSNKTVQIRINQNQFIPQTTKITVCDTIVFYNISKKYLDIGFGEHPIHLIYPKYHEKILSPGEKISLQMTSYGDFKIHEHIYDRIEGDIQVGK